MIFISRLGCNSDPRKNWLATLLIHDAQREALEKDIALVSESRPLLSQALSAIVVSYQECGCAWNEHTPLCEGSKRVFGISHDARKLLSPTWDVFVRKHGRYAWESPLLFVANNGLTSSEWTLFDVHPFLFVPSNSDKESRNQLFNRLKPLLNICEALYILDEGALFRALLSRSHYPKQAQSWIFHMAERRILNKRLHENAPQFPISFDETPVQKISIGARKHGPIVFCNDKIPNDFLESQGYFRSRHCL